MCIRNIVKMTASVFAMLFALVCLAKMLMLEVSTAKPDSFAHYFQWALQLGMLMLAVSVSYVLFAGENDIRTASEEPPTKS